MTTIRTARLYALRRKTRQRSKQPGIVARICKACALHRSGHSWRWAWRETGKTVVK